MKGLLLLFLICTAEAFIDLLEILEKRRHHITSSEPEDDNKTAVADQSSITVDPKTLQLADDKLASGGVQWLDDYDDYETDDYEEYEDYYEYIHSPYRPTSNKPWSSSTIIPPERLKCPKRRAKPFGGSPSLLCLLFLNLSTFQTVLWFASPKTTVIRPYVSVLAKRLCCIVL